MVVVTHMRHISPPREELERLRTPLTPGEREVLDRLDQGLPQDWELYVQPHLNGLRPDIVAFSPHRGVAVLEIKDWESVSAEWLRRAVAKLEIYEDELEDLYCPTVGDRAGRVFPSVSSRLVLTRISRRTLRLVAPGLAARKVVCAGELDQLTRLLPGAFHEADGSVAAEDLRSWLEEPRCSKDQRHPLFRELTTRQRLLVGRRPGASGMWRLRGSAGAGKSLVLAARAAHLAKFEGKRGLVTAFNLTLLHYLRDLAVRYPLPERNSLVNEHITWLHFHAWCKRICHAAGMSDRYRALWEERGEASIARVLEVDVPALTREALEIESPAYDFILVDEGQDWNLEWWNTLRRALRPGGEMLLVADRTQDVYGKRGPWTEEAMAGAGFRGGKWASLEVSHRIPPAVLPVLRDFATNVIRDDVLVPEPDPQLTLDACSFSWRNVRPGTEAAHCVDAVSALHASTRFAGRVSPPDIVILVQQLKTGQACVAALEARGYHVCHTLSRDGRTAKRLKHAFFRGDARVKVTTAYSFKGFENSLMVVVLTKARTERDARVVYAALSRVKRDPAGSALVVLNSTNELGAFGAKWSAALDTSDAAP